MPEPPFEVVDFADRPELQHHRWPRLVDNERNQAFLDDSFHVEVRRMDTIEAMWDVATFITRYARGDLAQMTLAGPCTCGLLKEPEATKGPWRVRTTEEEATS